MVNLKKHKNLKSIGNIIISVLALVAVVVFFESMKVIPDTYTVCKAPRQECTLPESEIATPVVDTAAIVQIAIDKIREEIKYELLESLAGKKLWGIDISKYQSYINWNTMVRKNKPDFVFVKATEGTTIVDPMYKSHKKNLEKHDILHGAYHFMSFSSSGRRQAQKFIRHAGLRKGNMVPVLDVEYTRSRMPHKRKVIREIKAYCKTIEAHYGVKPIIYTHPHLYSKYLKGSFGEYPLWICDYRNNPRHEWAIWQHTARARLYGYNGKLDKNVMKSDKETLKTLLML